MLLQQLLNELILARDFLFEDTDDVVLAGKHILEVPRQRVEAMMRVLDGLFLDDGHATLVAVVSARALRLLVLHDAHSLHFSSAVDARHQDVGTRGFVLGNLFAHTLGFALGKSRAFHRLEVAVLVVVLHVDVG